MATVCQRCGEENKAGARYCTRCAFDMSSGATMQTPPPDVTQTSAPTSAGTDPLIGQEVGGCLVIEKIGQGGMGAVYRGTQTSRWSILSKTLETASSRKAALRRSALSATFCGPSLMRCIMRTSTGTFHQVHFDPGK